MTINNEKPKQKEEKNLKGLFYIWFDKSAKFF